MDIFVLEFLTSICICTILNTSEEQQLPSDSCKQEVPHDPMDYGSVPAVLDLCDLGKSHDFEYTVNSYNKTRQITHTTLDTGGKEVISV